MVRRRTRIILAVVGLVLLFALTAVAAIGPRFLIGLIRYDQRQEGRLAAGDRAPDVDLVTLGEGKTHLLGAFAQRPLVLVFGSFT